MPATRQIDVKEAYFSWLYGQLFEVQRVTSEYSYTAVCRSMHGVIFQALVEHDANRIAEAAELRNEFKRRIRPVAMDLTDIMLPDASVFEVLIALAKRADFMVTLGVPTWFQIFMENLKLDRFSDPVFAMSNTTRSSAHHQPVQRASLQAERPRWYIPARATTGRPARSRIVVPDGRST